MKESYRCGILTLALFIFALPLSNSHALSNRVNFTSTLMDAAGPIYKAVPHKMQIPLGNSLFRDLIPSAFWTSQLGYHHAHSSTGGQIFDAAIAYPESQSHPWDDAEIRQLGGIPLTVNTVYNRFNAGCIQPKAFKGNNAPDLSLALSTFNKALGDLLSQGNLTDGDAGAMSIYLTAVHPLFLAPKWIMEQGKAVYKDDGRFPIRQAEMLFLAGAAIETATAFSMTVRRINDYMAQKLGSNDSYLIPGTDIKLVDVIERLSNEFFTVVFVTYRQLGEMEDVFDDFKVSPYDYLNMAVVDVALALNRMGYYQNAVYDAIEQNPDAFLLNGSNSLAGRKDF